MSRFAALLLGLLLLGCGGRGAPPDAAAGPAPTSSGGSQGSGSLGSGSLGGGSLGSGSLGGTSATSAGNATVGGTVNSTEGGLIPIDEATSQALVDGECNAWRIEPEPERALTRIEWLVDASSSMAEPAFGSDVIKWGTILTAVRNAISHLENTDTCRVRSMGALAFPAMATDDLIVSNERPISTCVDLSSRIPAATGSGIAIVTYLSGLKPQGATPTIDAYRAMIERLESDDSSQLRDIVLVTDGMPTMDSGCRNPPGSSDYADYWHQGSGSGTESIRASVDSLLSDIDRAHVIGIRTFVLGVTDSDETRAVLSKAAQFGGTARPNCDPAGGAPLCHFDLATAPNAADELVNALVARRNDDPAEELPCRFDVPIESADGTRQINPEDTRSVITLTTGQQWLILPDSGPPEDCTEGFRYLGSSQMELCPKACAFLRSACLARLDMTFGCEASSASTR